ncbi:hypothetical protein KAI04_00065 [Candidatus Pacearchaeota archaeon]|nr:hypothetical protein [Candidatus Pacearchaeota archaeon]
MKNKSKLFCEMNKLEQVKEIYQKNCMLNRFTEFLTKLKRRLKNNDIKRNN